MSQLTENLTVTSQQAKPAVKAAMLAGRPSFLWGPPGVGKSELVQQIAEDMGNCLVIDLRMAQMEPTDIRGIPFFNKELGVMDWAPPIELPSEELAAMYDKIILFLDEMNSAPPAVQAAGYQLVLNGRVGKYILPKNCHIVAAGNRDSDKGVTYRMPMPLAVLNNVHEDVVGYLSFAKQDLYDFDAKSSSRAFATPRTWTFVSQLLQSDELDTDTLYNLVAGTVGEGLATKFMAHRKVASKMPNPSDILSGKTKELNVKEISAMYSLTISMCYELKNALETDKVDNKKFHEMCDNFFGYIMANFETELVVMGAKVALKTYKLPIEPSQLKNFDEFHKRYGGYIVEAGN